MKIHDAFLFCLDAPYVYIVSEKYEREYNECMCFLVKITSIPSPCHAQWYMKPKGDDKFTPLDVNAEGVNKLSPSSKVSCDRKGST